MKEKRITKKRPFNRRAGRVSLLEHKRREIHRLGKEFGFSGKEAELIRQMGWIIDDWIRNNWPRRKGQSPPDCTKTNRWWKKNRKSLVKLLNACFEIDARQERPTVINVIESVFWDSFNDNDGWWPIEERPPRGSKALSLYEVHDWQLEKLCFPSDIGLPRIPLAALGVISRNGLKALLRGGGKVVMMMRDLEPKQRSTIVKDERLSAEDLKPDAIRKALERIPTRRMLRTKTR